MKYPCTAVMSVNLAVVFVNLINLACLPRCWNLKMMKMTTSTTLPEEGRRVGELSCAGNLFGYGYSVGRYGRQYCRVLCPARIRRTARISRIHPAPWMLKGEGASLLSCDDVFPETSAR